MIRMQTYHDIDVIDHLTKNYEKIPEPKRTKLGIRYIERARAWYKEVAEAPSRFPKTPDAFANHTDPQELYDELIDIRNILIGLVF